MKFLFKLLLIGLGIGILLVMLAMIFLPDNDFMNRFVTRNEAYGEIIIYEEENMIDELVLDLENRHIEINYVDEDMLSVSYYKKDTDTFNISVVEDKLTVIHEFETIWSQFMMFNFVSKEYVTVIVDIPNTWELSILDLHTETGDITLTPSLEKTYEKLSINNSTGSVELSNVVTDQLSVETATGDILMKDVVVLGNASVKIYTGDIDITNLEVEDLIVDTATGDVELSNITAYDVEVESSTGKIKVFNSVFDTLDVSLSTGSIVLSDVISSSYLLKTSTGDITVVLDSIDDYRFDLETNTGKVKVDGLSQGDTYRTSSGTIILDAYTSTGNINIEVDA